MSDASQPPASPRRVRVYDYSLALLRGLLVSLAGLVGFALFENYPGLCILALVVMALIGVFTHVLAVKLDAHRAAANATSVGSRLPLTVRLLNSAILATIGGALGIVGHFAFSFRVQMIRDNFGVDSVANGIVFWLLVALVLLLTAAYLTLKTARLELDSRK